MDAHINYTCVPVTKTTHIIRQPPFFLQGGAAGFDTGKGEKLSSSQAQQAMQAAWLLLSFSPFPVLNPAAPPCTHWQHGGTPKIKGAEWGRRIQHRKGRETKLQPDT